MYYENFFIYVLKSKVDILITFKDIKTKGNFQENKKNEPFSLEIFVAQNFKRDT